MSDIGGSHCRCGSNASLASSRSSDSYEYYSLLTAGRLSSNGQAPALLDAEIGRAVKHTKGSRTCITTVHSSDVLYRKTQFLAAVILVQAVT